MLHRDGELRRLILVCYGLWCALIFLCDAQACYQGDKEALLKFKSSLVDPGEYLFWSWSIDTDCCTWSTSLICSNETGRVVSLHLVSPESGSGQRAHRNTSYPGFVGSSLGRLEELRVLYIQNILFEGPLPVEWADLKNLETLHCNGCALYGPIDQIPWENLSNLSELSMSFTSNLSGLIPLQVCKLPSLTTLKLEGNQFTGSIPACIHELANLMELNFSENKLNGTIPESIGSLSMLRTLDLGGNKFHGVIPSSLGNLKGMTQLQIDRNGLQGQIPTSLCSLPNLSLLALSSNLLNGTISECLGYLPSMTFLNVDDNMLSGNFPSPLLQIPYVCASNNALTGWSWNFDTTFDSSQYVDLSKNRLLGPIPLELCNFTSGFGMLNLADNLLTGPLLPCLGEIHENRELSLDMSFNFLNGEIPVTFGSGKLFSLNLKRNNLSGRMDQVFSKKNYDFKVNGSLKYLDLSDNQLSGPVPDDLALQSDLQFLSLSNNSFSGGFPSCVIDFVELKVLDLSDNNFTGELPLYMPALASRLEKLSLGNNSFTGTIPRDYDGPWNFMEFIPNVTSNINGSTSWRGGWNSCKLISFSLHNNQLTGSIPDSMGDCESLGVFDGSSNQLSGTLPFWLYNNTELSVFAVNNNQIEGEIADLFDLRNSSKLRLLSLKNNKLRGNLPSTSLYSLESLRDPFPLPSDEKQTLTPSNNVDRYQESILVSYKGNTLTWKYLLYAPALLDLSCNSLTGSIPSTLGLLSQIVSVNFSYNLLRGQIPPHMGNLLQIEAMDLSHNFLHGMIPRNFSYLSFLSSINLSYNALYGPLPVGTQWSTFSESSFMVNDGLCCISTSMCNPSNYIPMCKCSNFIWENSLPQETLELMSSNVSIPAFVVGYILSFSLFSYLFMYGYPHGGSFKMSSTLLF